VHLITDLTKTTGITTAKNGFRNQHMLYSCHNSDASFFSAGQRDLIFLIHSLIPVLFYINLTSVNLKPHWFGSTSGNGSSNIVNVLLMVLNILRTILN